MANTQKRDFDTELEVEQFYKQTGTKVVIFKGVVYEVGDYMRTHPGGEDLIENELGKSIDAPFEEAEHTKSALNIFLNLPVIGKVKELESTSCTDSDHAQAKENGGLQALYGLELNSQVQFDYN